MIQLRRLLLNWGVWFMLAMSALLVFQAPPGHRLGSAAIMAVVVVIALVGRWFRLKREDALSR